MRLDEKSRRFSAEILNGLQRLRGNCGLFCAEESNDLVQDRFQGFYGFAPFV
jgi:hypothetical protein